MNSIKRATTTFREHLVMSRYFPDHGLPLVQLKEQRRNLVVAHQKRNGPLTNIVLMEIAAVQQAISAFEDVMSDLEAELEPEVPAIRKFTLVA